MKKKNKVLKVLQVIPKLGYGGAETGCYDLAHFLPEKKCKSYIATSGGELLKFVDKKKVKVFKLPVQSKNPILIVFNAVLISFIVLFYNINIIHARSRAPAWSCLIASKMSFFERFLFLVSIACLSFCFLRVAYLRSFAFFPFSAKASTLLSYTCFLLTIFI